MEAFKKALGAFLQSKGIAEDATVTYEVLYKARCNTVMNKENVLDMVRQALLTLNSKVHFKADLDNPDVCFNFELIKAICCVTILPEYFVYRKYNLVELGKHSIKDLNPARGSKRKRPAGLSIAGDPSPDDDVQAKKSRQDPCSVAEETSEGPSDPCQHRIDEGTSEEETRLRKEKAEHQPVPVAQGDSEKLSPRRDASSPSPDPKIESEAEEEKRPSRQDSPPVDHAPETPIQMQETSGVKDSDPPVSSEEVGQALSPGEAGTRGLPIKRSQPS